MRPEAVLFDAEGVVIDTEPAWDEAQGAFLARRGIEYDRNLVKPLLTGRSLKDGTQTLIDLYGLSGGVEELSSERSATVRDLMTSAKFMPGFEDFFGRVRDQYRTCVATAMADELFDVVDRCLGIRDLFGGRVYTLADVGQRSKPDPALFLFAAAQLAVPPARCLVIEDSPYGVDAARRAGMAVVGLAGTYEPPLLDDADFVVGSFAELDLTQLGGAGG